MGGCIGNFWKKNGALFKRAIVGPPPIQSLIDRQGGSQKVLKETLANGDPQGHLKLVGAVLFDWVYQTVKDSHGVRMEELLAILASVGGHGCILGALDTHFKNGGNTPENGLKIFTGNDGVPYYFGDLPNRALLESPESLISLTLAAAQGRGGNVSLEKVHDAMRHVVETIGTPSFGIPRIVENHQPYDHPFKYIRNYAPALFKIIREYGVSLDLSASAFGFAIYKAIAMVDRSLDPTTAADIVTECAIPAAKIDPARFPHFREVMTP